MLKCRKLQIDGFSVIWVKMPCDVEYVKWYESVLSYAFKYSEPNKKTVLYMT